MSKFQVGDRVRCVNQSRFAGREGTVIRIRQDYVDEPAFHYIEWDGESVGSLQGGSWTEGALEVIEPERDLQAEIDALTAKYESALHVKNGALLIAAEAFRQYTDHHFAKLLPESTIKALTNAGLEQLMNDALEAD